ncbi:MAG: methyl-accepting chemotaxis protein [Deferribacterota bacterium]|nr:methyl-accepting chemotaxis protein [Deferribacterota bacterium]
MKKIPLFRRLSIQTIGITILATIVFLFVLVLINIEIGTNLALKVNKDEYKELYEEINTSIKAYFDDRVGVISLIAKSKEFIDFLEDPEDVDKATIAFNNIHRFSNIFNDIIELSIIYMADNPVKTYTDNKTIAVSKGDIILSNIEKNIGSEFPHREVMNRDFKSDSYYISQAEYNKELDAFLIDVLLPVKAFKGRALVSITISLSDYVKSHISTIGVGDTGRVLLLDSNRNIIYNKGNKGDNGFLELPVEPEEIFKKIDNSNYDFIYDVKGEGKYRFLIFPLVLKNSQATYYFVGYQDLAEITMLSKSFTQNTIIMSLIFLFVLATLLYFIFQKIFNKRIWDLINKFRDISESREADLTKKLTIERNDELSLIAKYFNDFIDTIREIIGSTRENMIDVSSAYNQLSSSMEQVARTTSEQSGQISEVASAMEELSASSFEVSETAVNTKEKVESARDKTYEGRKLLQKVVETINIINENTENLSRTVKNLLSSSMHIGNILNVINDIADQTNLLALNAAIEAARAGEAGRGFAVVAEEVRKLAERTTSSTKEIANIIKSLQAESEKADENMLRAKESVDEGVKAVDDTNKIFMDIVSVNDAVFDASSQIESSIKEQAATVSRTNDNVQVIASGIEESSRAITEVTNTIADLQRKVEELKVIVEKFKV